MDWNGAPLEHLLPEIIYSEIGKEMSSLYVGPDVFCSFEPRVSSSSPGDSSLDWLKEEAASPPKKCNSCWSLYFLVILYLESTLLWTHHGVLTGETSIGCLLYFVKVSSTSIGAAVLRK